MPDDGRVVLSYVSADNKLNSRRNVVKLGMAMKSGKHLGLGKGVISLSLKEFKITPHKYKSPFNIDGDPHDVSDVHVTCLPQALRLFYLPVEDPIGSIVESEAVDTEGTSGVTQEDNEANVTEDKNEATQ